MMTKARPIPYTGSNSPGAPLLVSFRKHISSAVRDMRNVASLFPSSPFAVRSILKAFPESTHTVIEYGPGTGIVTREILRRLPPIGKVVALELNSRFFPLLESFGDPRLELQEGNVFDLLPPLQTTLAGRVDVVVSGIPFTVLSKQERERLMAQTHSLIRPGGRFVVYQNSRLILPLLRKHFGVVRVKFEPRNILPYFIMAAERSK